MAYGNQGLKRCRSWLVVIGSLVLMGLSARPVQAGEQADFPNRTVRLQVGFVAGGAVDAIARDLGKALGDKWSQSVVVENKVGASGTIAATSVASAAPDGYNLLLTSDSPIVSAPFLNDKLAYDPQVDLSPISLVSGFPLILVANENLKIKTIAELIALAKASSGSLAYASTGIGTSSHLPMEAFQEKANVTLLHIPYKGGGQAMNELVGGAVPLMLTTYALASPYLKTGKLVAVAVGSSRRMAQLPDIPTFAEQGFPTVEAGNWIGVFGPKAMKASLVERINQDLNEIVRSTAYQEKMTSLGFEGRTSTPAEFSALINKDFARSKVLFGKLDTKKP